MCGPRDERANIGAPRRAPTTARNALRVLRALQLRRGVLLEGSPGVGKTALVAALAAAAGVPVQAGLL
jgi:midasin